MRASIHRPGLARLILATLPALVGACGSPEATPTEECPAGQVPEGDACVPEACGTGDWGDLEVDATTVYVQAGASGDGSAASPLGSIQAGADLAGSRGGGLVAIAAGIYVENLELGEAHRGVTLAGRCREQVVIDGSQGAGKSTILVQGERRRVEVAVRDLRVQGGPLGGLAFAVAQVDVVHVDVADNARAGVMVYDADVRLEDVDVSGTVEGGNSRVGAGVEVQIGTLEVVDSRIGSNADEGVRAQGPRSQVTLSNVTVRDNGAFGVEVLEAADMVIAGGEVAGNTEADVVADGSGTTLRMTGTLVAGTRPEAGRTSGMVARDGAAVVLEEVVIEGPSGSGFVVEDAGTTVEASRLTLSGLAGEGTGDPGFGHGLVVRDGATLSATELVSVGNSGVGLGVEGGALLDLVGADVRGNGGRGADVIGGGRLVLTGSNVADNVQVGIFIDEPGSLVELVATSVIGTIPDVEGTYGHGVIVRDGGALSGTSSVISGNTRTACFLEGAGATAELTDVALDDTVPDTWGTGAALVLRDGAYAHVAGGTAVGSGYAALGVIGAGTRLEVEGLYVADVALSATGRGGYGIVADSGGQATLSGVEIERASGIGLIAQGPETRVTVRGGRLTDTLRNRTSRVAAGVVSQLSARVELYDGLVEGTEGPGAVAVADGELLASGMRFDANEFAGAVLLGPGLLELQDVEVTADPLATSGVGVYAWNGRLVATGLQVGPHPHAAMWFEGQGAYEVVDSDLAGSSGIDLAGRNLHGNAVYAQGGATPWDGALGLRLAGNRLHGASGPALMLDGASALLEDNVWEGNAQDVWQQRCDGFAPLPSPGTGAVCDGTTLLVDTGLTFPRFALSNISLEEP